MDSGRQGSLSASPSGINMFNSTAVPFAWRDLLGRSWGLS